MITEDCPRPNRRPVTEHREPCHNCQSQPTAVVRETELEFDDEDEGIHAMVCPRCGYGGWYFKTPEEAARKWDEYCKAQKTTNHIDFIRAVLSGPLSASGKSPKQIGETAVQIAVSALNAYQRARANTTKNSGDGLKTDRPA